MIGLHKSHKTKQFFTILVLTAALLVLSNNSYAQTDRSVVPILNDPNILYPSGSWKKTEVLGADGVSIRYCATEQSYGDNNSLSIAADSDGRINLMFASERLKDMTLKDNGTVVLSGKGDSDYSTDIIRDVPIKRHGDVLIIAKLGKDTAFFDALSSAERISFSIDSSNSDTIMLPLSEMALVHRSLNTCIKSKDQPSTAVLSTGALGRSGLSADSVPLYPDVKLKEWEGKEILHDYPPKNTSGDTLENVSDKTVSDLKKDTVLEDKPVTETQKELTETSEKVSDLSSELEPTEAKATDNLFAKNPEPRNAPLSLPVEDTPNDWVEDSETTEGMVIPEVAEKTLVKTSLQAESIEPAKSTSDLPEGLSTFLSNAGVAPDSSLPVATESLPESEGDFSPQYVWKRGVVISGVMAIPLNGRTAAAVIQSYYDGYADRCTGHFLPAQDIEVYDETHGVSLGHMQCLTPENPTITAVVFHLTSSILTIFENTSPASASGEAYSVRDKIAEAISSFQSKIQSDLNTKMP